MKDENKVVYVKHTILGYEVYFKGGRDGEDGIPRFKTIAEAKLWCRQNNAEVVHAPWL